MPIIISLVVIGAGAVVVAVVELVGALAIMLICLLGRPISVARLR